MEVPLAENWALVTRACARGARILLNAAPAAPIPGLALAALDWLVVNETEALILAGRLGTAGGDPEPAGRPLAHALGIDRKSGAKGKRESTRVDPGGSLT